MEVIFQHSYTSTTVKVRVNKIIEEFQQSRNKNIDLPTFVSFIRTETPHGIVWYTSNRIEIVESFDHLPLLNYLNKQWLLVDGAAEERTQLPLGLYNPDCPYYIITHILPFGT